MLTRSLPLALVVLSLCPSLPAQAQVFLRPNPAPLVTADSTAWFGMGEPLTFSGSFYYPAGPRVFFDGNVMVRVGDYRGVPLYADATLEPYSVVFVPLSGSMMQPYERPRVDAIAGTTGSRAPSFPVNTSAEPLIDGFARGMTLTPPPYTLGPITPSAVSPTAIAQVPAAPVVPTGSIPRATTPRLSEAGSRGTSGSTRTPMLSQIWIEHNGERWSPAGAAVLFESDRFVATGEYHGFPVFAERSGSADIMYVPVTKDGMLTPYRRGK